MPSFTICNKIERVLWNLVYFVFFRFTPVPFFIFRILILKIFGDDIHWASRVYPSAVIWLPRNLTLGQGSTIGPRSKIYNQGKISIGETVIISQGAHLCASTHNYHDAMHPLVLAPITIGSKTWVCAEAFIGPNVSIEEVAVIGARSVVTSKNIEAWSVYGGNPAIKIKTRTVF